MSHKLVKPTKPLLDSVSVALKQNDARIESNETKTLPPNDKLSDSTAAVIPRPLPRVATSSDWLMTVEITRWSCWFEGL